MKSRALTKLNCIYGTAFFDGDVLVKYIHENDGTWRDEYFSPILEYFGINIVESDQPTNSQKKLLQNYYGEFDEDT